MARAFKNLLMSNINHILAVNYINMVHAKSGSHACTMSSSRASYSIEVVVVPLTATRVTASRNQCVLVLR